MLSNIFHASAINSLELAGLEALRHVVEQAQAELEARTALWLRGLLSLDVPDPLVQDYCFVSSFTSLDVIGKILAGDGSEGRNSKDLRTRRCCFDDAVLALLLLRLGWGEGIGSGHAPSQNLWNQTDSVTARSPPAVLGSAFGSVPGKQTAPRAEALGLLHALMI